MYIRYTCIRAYVHIHTYTCIPTYTCIRTYTCNTYIYMHTCVYLNTYMHTCNIHAYMVSICTYMNVYCTYILFSQIFLPKRRGRDSLPAEGNTPVQAASNKMFKRMQNAVDVFRSRNPSFWSVLFCLLREVNSATVPVWL